jgi:hypothetical protein
MNVNLDRFLNSIIYCDVALSGQTNLNRSGRFTVQTGLVGSAKYWSRHSARHNSIVY